MRTLTIVFRMLVGTIVGWAMGLAITAFPDPQAMMAFYGLGVLYTAVTVLHVFSIRRSLFIGLIFPVWWWAVFYVSMRGPTSK